MSFKIQWPSFTREFLNSAKAQLGAALNKGNKPPNIVGDIIVKELYMGSKVRLFTSFITVINDVYLYYFAGPAPCPDICHTPIDQFFSR